MLGRKEKRILRAAVCFLAFCFALPPGLLFCTAPSAVGAAAVFSPSATADGAAAPGDGAAAREMRGLWIASVGNIDFPSAQNLSAKALAGELDAIVDFAAACGMNAILFQVRPAADALYASAIFPPSVYVSGRAGAPPDENFDCLSYLTAAAHRKQIEVHAWINPLRAGSGSPAHPFDRRTLAETSPAARHPAWTVEYADGRLYFDPGIPAVRALVAAGVREICENYDVDGIVFDDYFYPYPVEGALFDDADTYKTYGGDFADLGDFRRENVRKLVRLCYDTVKAADPAIRFGVSPFGIWKNDTGRGVVTRGAEGYADIYCDALSFAEGGYVDYLAPQIYWTFDHSAAPFFVLADFWDRALEGSGVDLYIGHGIYRYADGSFPRGELTAQVLAARELSACRGGLYYGYGALRANAGGVLDEIRVLFSEDR